ncbi:MAG: HD domain-containing phosphohydrolase [Limnochordales bacterium]
MRRINLRSAPVNVVLARPLVDERGAYVLAAGQPLTLPAVDRLWERGFRWAYVEHIGFEGLPVREPLEPKTYMAVRQLLRRLILQVRDLRAAKTLSLPYDELNEAVAMACDDLSRLKPGEGFLFYPTWGALIDERIALAINTGVVAALVGRAMKGDTAARHLFTAALLQDLGLWLAERVQDHVDIIRELLRPLREVSPLVKTIAAQHHERLDGSGYPDRLTGAAMHPLSLIMSVAVAYVEMVCVSRGALPHEAQEAIMAGAGTEFDLETVRTLIKFVPGYPVGTVVRLSDGCEAVVIHPGPPGLNRPRVRVLPARYARVGERPATEEEAVKAREAMKEVDLAGQYTLAIARIIE